MSPPILVFYWRIKIVVYTLPGKLQKGDKINRYVIELQNLITGGIAITHVEDISLDIVELEKSLPSNYKFITYWIE